MNRVTLVLAGLGLVLAAVEVEAEPVQWRIEDGGNGHWYEPVKAGPEGISWSAAAAAATDVGGYLATITSLAENEFAFELVSNDLDYWFNSDNGFSIGPWLGGYQASGAREPSGDWRWVTHPDESFTTFTNWLPGQPNDSGLLNQQSLHFIGRGGDNPSSSWNDLNGITPEHPIRGYIVETIPEPSTLTLLTIGAVGLLAGGWWLANSSS